MMITKYEKLVGNIKDPNQLKAETFKLMDLQAIIEI